MADKSIDGYADGYGVGLAGGHQRPHLTTVDADRWLRRCPATTRRRWARGFAMGAFQRLKWDAKAA